MVIRICNYLFFSLITYIISLSYNLKEVNRVFLLFTIFLIVFGLYYPALTTYFSQDDFFMFKVSQTNGTFSEFIKLFGAYSFEERGIAFYRPIVREVPFNIYYSLFGLNALPFRIILFLVHFTNIYLVYLLFQNLFKKNLISLFTAFFFGISAANVSVLYYLAGGIETAGATMFALFTLIFYKSYIDSSRQRFYYCALITFVLSLASHEINLSLPLILTVMIVTSNASKKLFLQFCKLLPFYLLLFITLYIDLFIIGFSSSEKQYQFILNIKTLIQSFIWYSLWSFGLPETLQDFVLPGLKLNPTLMRYWGDYYRIIFPTFFVSISLLLIFFLYLLKNSRKIFTDKKFLFLIFWFIMGISPVILLPFHKSSHYLSFVLPAFWGAIFYICVNTYERLKSFKSYAIAPLFLFIFSTFALSFTSVKLGENNYWAATRGKISEKLISDLKQKYPTLPKGAIVYFTNDPTYPFISEEWGGTSKQASLILNGSDGVQLLYNDPTLQVVYEDLNSSNSKFLDNNTFYIMAKVD